MPLPPPESMEFNSRRWTAGYGRTDTHRLNPARLSQPLPETVELLVDERSQDIAPLFADIGNLDIERTRLPVGDLCAVHGDAALLFALTTGHELCEAMDDGRIGALARNLGRIAHPACIIVEGGLYHERGQPLPRLAALHARLVFGINVPVIETIDRRHTAYMVVCCLRDRFFSQLARNRFEPHPAPLPHVGPHEAARCMLEMVPGVSEGRARALLERFGSIAAIATASPKELAETDGIGRVTAGRLLDILGERPSPPILADDGIRTRPRRWTAIQRF